MLHRQHFRSDRSWYGTKRKSFRAFFFLRVGCEGLGEKVTVNERKTADRSRKTKDVCSVPGHQCSVPGQK